MENKDVLTPEMLMSLEFDELEKGKHYSRTIGDRVIDCEKNIAQYWTVKIAPITPICYNKILSLDELRRFIEYTCSDEPKCVEIIAEMDELLK